MKKTLLIAVLLIAFCLMTNVFAAGVAKIGTNDYSTLSEAITAAGSSATTITLTQDISLDSKLSFPKGCNITLDLNGKTLNVPTVENNYGIVVLGTLTIKGDGTVNLGMYGIGVGTTGNLTIESGTYKCLTGDYLLGCWNKAVIKGGLFDGNYCIANGFDNGTIEILDGTFYSKESTIVLGNTKIFSGTFNQDVNAYLADGIEMNKYNGLYFTGKVYKITVENSKNGTISTLSEAIEEQPVKITVSPNKGYEANEIKVMDANNKLIAISQGEFVMPSSNVTITSTFDAVELDKTPTTGNPNPLFLISIIIAVLSLISIISIKLYLRKE